MDTNFLKLYIDNNIKLLKTLVIKSSVSADSINNMLLMKYGRSTDLNAPTTWKYYLNISGQYHYDNLVNGKRMEITSIDTLTTIEFTKENIIKGSSTYNAYAYGTRYYYSLLENYPENEQLILGILYPVDINKAIESEDGAILSYPSELVEPQEQSLLSDLELAIKNYLIRWHIKAYAVSDSLYNAAQHAILYLNLLPIIINLRLERAKTSEAHSFHIREYLASHGGLDKYMIYLTLEQILYLYRNIKYLERHSGSVKQFGALIENLLTKKDVLISSYSIKHKTIFDDSHYPLFHVRKKPLNSKVLSKKKDAILEIEDVFIQEHKVSKDNLVYLNQFDSRINTKIKNSTSSILQTKILETTVDSFKNVEPDTLETILLKEWVNCIFNDKLIMQITFTNPKTLVTKSISAKDAFIYMNYLINQKFNIKQTKPLVYLNVKQKRLLVPSLSDVLKHIDITIPDIVEIATLIHSRQLNKPIFVTSQNFYAYHYNEFKETSRLWYFLSNIDTPSLRQAVAVVINLLYEDVYYEVNGSINTWLIEKGLPDYTLNEDETDLLVDSLFSLVTGLAIDKSKSASNIQKALVNIMKQLSSYTVQFINETKEQDVLLVNNNTVRTENKGNLKTTFSAYFLSNYVTLTDNL